MSMTKTELKKLVEELQSQKKEKEINVRVREDVHKEVKNHLQNTKQSISNFVTIAAIEKLIREK